MTTATTNPVLNHANDAEFRVWAEALSDVMIAAGLVQTSDTGQLDIASATRPGTNTMAGYHMFRFNDALQGTAPIFIKVEFGTATSAANPQWQLSIGTATNGAGTLTGNKWGTPTLMMVSSAPTGLSVVNYACHTEGYFMVRPHTGAAQHHGGAFIIERTRDELGVATADGLILALQIGSAAPNLVVCFYFYDTLVWSHTTLGHSANLYSQFPTPGTTLVVGTSVLTFPIQWLSHLEDQPLYRTLGILIGSFTDFTVNTNSDLDRYDGITHTYRAMDFIQNSGRILALWE